MASDAGMTSQSSNGIEPFLILPRMDRPFMPSVEANFSGRVIDYESLGEEAIWSLRPRTVILLPFKRPPFVSHNDPISGPAAFTLRRWFVDGCHLIAVVPRRESEGQSYRDGDLRWATAALLEGAVPRFRISFMRSTAAPGRTTIIERVESLSVRPIDIHFFIRTVDPAVDPVFPRPVYVSEPLHDSMKSGGEFTTLAENAHHQTVMITFRQGAGRITVVPRGMLTGQHSFLNDAIPRFAVLRFPSDYRVNMSISELADRQNAPRLPKGAMKSVILVNGHVHRVAWLGRLFLQLIYNATYDERRSGRRTIAPPWPRVLERAKTRESASRSLREDSPRLGFELLAPGTPTTPPTLSTAASAGLDALETGWERWDSLGDAPEPDFQSLAIDAPVPKRRGG